jgi:hypothetical protein
MSGVSAVIAAVPAVAMQDLELEQAELLPARETLCCCKLLPTEGPSAWRE